MNRRLIIALLVYLFANQTFAATVQQSWQQFYQEMWSTQPLTVSQDSLSQYPAPLLLDTAQYPDFEHYSWQDLKLLAQIRTNCQPPLDARSSLHTAIEYEVAMCQQIALPSHWFEKNAKRHPAGGSYAERYLDINADSPIRHELLRYVSTNHPDHPLNNTFRQLSVEGKDNLLKGFRAWLEPDALWLNSEQGWKKIDSKDWQPVAKKFEIVLDSGQCDFRYSNLCIARQVDTINLYIILSISCSALLGLALLRALYVKRQQTRNKRFVLQLLTHELRTPISSLSMTIDTFKEEYDQLSDKAQHATLRLLADYQRLAQLTEASKDYLSNVENYSSEQQIANLSEWLEHICEMHNVDFELNQDKQVSLPFYWLTLCLNNLIANAKQHGADPIMVKVVTDSHLRITVCDNGTFPSYWQRFTSQRNSSPNNMGIGLSLVKHLIKHMGGKLILQSHPTRISIELPL